MSSRERATILVGGESLIDLIVDARGSADPKPGGGPYNVARTVARLGGRAAFLGTLSSDPFGELLRRHLAEDGVELVLPEPVAAPSTLAIVSVSPGGQARYWFHLQGTAAFALEDPEAAGPALGAAAALHVGTLGLVVEPMASTLEGLVLGLSDRVLCMLDPNCRPGAIADRAGYLRRIDRLLARADVVKASTEDLDYLLPGRSPAEGARELLEAGARVVLVTDGAAPARAFLGDQAVSVPSPPVEVVDTVGAGDAFGGAFLAWWVADGLGRAELGSAGAVEAATVAAVGVAAATCGRAGADPPRLEELGEDAGFRPGPGPGGPARAPSSPPRSGGT